MGFFDLIIVPLIILLGHSIVNQVVVRFSIQHHKPVLIRLFYYHLAFGLMYAIYVKVYGGDAIGYWKLNRIQQFMTTNSLLDLHQSGTPFILLLVYPFVKLLSLSYWSVTIVFSFVGFLGFLLLFLTLLRTLKTIPRIWGIAVFPAILFLPNMHFWSSGIGKDAVIFFALALFIFSLTKPMKNIVGLIFSLYLAYMIRPHIALLMMVGLIFALATSTGGVSFFWRFFLLVTSIYIFALITPSVLEFIGVEENIDNLEDVSDLRSQNLSKGSVGSTIEISSYSLPAKIGTFLFRPLFFDVNNIFGLIVSIENLIYIILFISILRISTLKEIFYMPAHLKASLIVLMSATFFMSSSLSNLGIIIRQKNMVMFMLVLICVYLISLRQASEVRSVRQPLPNS
jgi:hypothetical protein